MDLLLVYLLQIMVYSNLLPIFEISLFSVEFQEFCMYSGDQILIRNTIYKWFISFYELSFHVRCPINHKSFNEVQFTLSFRLLMILLYLRLHGLIQTHECFPLRVSHFQLIPLGLYFVLNYLLYTVCLGSRFFFFLMWQSFSQHHLLKSLFFPHQMVLVSLSKII